MDPDEIADRQEAAEYRYEEMEMEFGERARDPHFDERFSDDEDR